MKRQFITAGFTLIELLVVIGVLGIIATGLIIAINPAAQIAKGRDSSRKSALMQIRTSLDSYYLLHGRYPATSGWVNSTSGEEWLPGVVQSGDAKKLPVDPINRQTGGFPSSAPDNFAYYYRSDDYYDGNGGPDCGANSSNSYILVAILENKSDNQSGNTISVGNGEDGCAFTVPGAISIDQKTDIATIQGSPNSEPPTGAPSIPAVTCLSGGGSNIFVASPANGFVDNPTWTQGYIYRSTSVPNGRIFDATNQTYHYGLINPADGPQIYGIALRAGSNVCWSGGRIISTSVDSDHPSWETWHDLNGFRFGGMPNVTVENLYIRNFGDLLNISDNDGVISQNWTVRDSLLRHSHDDCIQNDKLAAGRLVNSFLDGCYTGVSARMSASDVSGGVIDGHNNVFEIENTLIWMQPTTPVYQNQGANPGHGGFFKWENDAVARGMKLSLVNVTLMALQDSNGANLGIDPATSIAACQNVTVIWLGPGSFPGANNFPPGCATFVTGEAGRQLWIQKVNEWYAAHPQFADLKQADDYYFSYHP